MLRTARDDVLCVLARQAAALLDGERLQVDPQHPSRAGSRVQQPRQRAHLPQHFLVVRELNDQRHLAGARKQVMSGWRDWRVAGAAVTHLERVLQPLGEVKRNQVPQVKCLRRRPLPPQRTPDQRRKSSAVGTGAHGAPGPCTGRSCADPSRTRPAAASNPCAGQSAVVDDGAQSIDRSVHAAQRARAHRCAKNMPRRSSTCALVPVRRSMLRARVRRARRRASAAGVRQPPQLDRAPTHRAIMSALMGWQPNVVSSLS